MSWGYNRLLKIKVSNCTAIASVDSLYGAGNFATLYPNYEVLAAAAVINEIFKAKVSGFFFISTKRGLTFGQILPTKVSDSVSIFRMYFQKVFRN